MRKIEALVDAIASLNSYADPESTSYQTRNPGLLRGHGEDAVNAEGTRIFTSCIGGYRALMVKLEFYCQSNPQKTVGDILKTVGYHDELATTVAMDFIKRALPTEAVDTKLEFFIGATNGNSQPAR